MVEDLIDQLGKGWLYMPAVIVMNYIVIESLGKCSEVFKMCLKWYLSGSQEWVDRDLSDKRETLL